MKVSLPLDSFFSSNINEIKALADADLIMPPKHLYRTKV
jgi:hypothetical protein